MDEQSIASSLKVDAETYDVSLVKETDELGNASEVLLLKNGEEEYRLSPNTTPAELERYADPCNKGYVL